MKKVFASIIVLALAVVVATPAKAMTDAELLAALKSLSPAQLTQLLSGASNSGSQLSTLTKNMKLGSRGDEVETLQKFLEEVGMLDTNGTYGYFGAKTKAAVIAYQKENGIPATGNVYSLTRAAINAEIEAAGSSTGESGASSGSGASVPATLDNTDGSITAADAAYVSTGATFKKGDTQNIYDVRLSATGGKVAVTRLDVKFSERPWLTLNKLVLKDSAGTVIAEKTLSSAADATEVTVGSDYRVRFENFNYVVTPGTDATLVVSATSMAASDKITTQTVTVSIPASAIRTVNGKGYSESIGGITAKTFTFSSTGSVADLNTSVSPNSPAKRFVTTSTSITPDVVLGVFRVKAVNNAATISALSVMIQRSTSAATSTLLTNLRLVAPDGTTYGAASLTAGQTFTNLNIKLPKDTWTDLTVKADINASQSLSASTTLDASTVVGIDDNYNTLTLTNASDVTANDVQFATGAAEVSSLAVTAGDVVGATCQSATCNVVKNYTFTFTLKNNSNSVLYASSTRSDLVATSSTGSVTGATVSSSTLQSLSANGTDANDTATNYAIQPGGSRTFTMTGVVGKIGGTPSYSELKITKIYFGGSAIATSYIDFGLDALKAGTTL